MPTPSNHPPDPASPSPPYTFPTCPDDQPYAARSQAHGLSGHDSDDMQVRPSSATVVESPPPYSSDPVHDGPAVDDIRPLDGQVHSEASARSRTIYSGTPSRTNRAPSPLLTKQEIDSSVDETKCDRSLRPSRESSITTSSLHTPTPKTTSAIDSMVAVMDVDGNTSPSSGTDYTRLRTIPISPSSYLRPGSKFHGTQRSERQVYEVQVEIKHVDMRESFLCGYLRIQGLTEDHPTLTTYFEGEIIGSKYNFYTQHEDWGANVKVDLNHWSKFRAFRPFFKMARKGPVSIPDNSQKEYIFMRWKEHFLVPDHRVRTITGASFEGFYYICFNQLKGEVSGIYFHSKSEKFQQLELKHVSDRGCFSALEFR